MAVLAVDVGQPLRFWFTFWYPNVHSMLTEVTFCITCYLTVLAIEYVPIVLKNRKLREIPSFLVFEFQLHKLIYVLAGVGTFLSFFHQGSLGGLYGVLRGRPFAFREGLAIWPSTFFLFIISAAAVGPSFVLLTTWMVEKITKKRLVRPEVLQLLGRISGLLLAVYVLAKTVDTLVWINRTSPAVGLPGGAVLQLAAVRNVDSVRGDRAVRPVAGAGAADAEAAGAARLAGGRGGVGVLRRGAEPLRADGADAGAADAAVRPVPVVLCRAGRRSGRSWRWWRTACWCTRSRSGICSCSRRSASCEIAPRRRRKRSRKSCVCSRGGIDMAHIHFHGSVLLGAGGGRDDAAVCVLAVAPRAAARQRRFDGTRTFTICPPPTASAGTCSPASSGAASVRTRSTAGCARRTRECRQPAAARRAPRRRSTGCRFRSTASTIAGHTWARLEPDGAVTVGLDELGKRLIGAPDAVDLPAPGVRIHANGTAFRVKKRDADVRVLSPVDGEVIETGGADRGWYLRVRPDSLDLRICCAGRRSSRG